MKLREGYTTGAHATSALKAALYSYITNLDNIHSVNITLPKGDLVNLNLLECVKKEKYSYIVVKKSSNDDIDVTQGCIITCWCSDNIINIPYNPHPIEHCPICFDLNNIKIYIYSGKGLGVATSDILTLKKSFPAINKIPLEMMKNEIEKVLTNHIPSMPIDELYFVFEVKDGEEIAKQTINQKLGIIGGISFIGKTGIVKPVSSYAFLHSIYAQVDYAANNHFHSIYFTVGNDSLSYAQQICNPEKDYIIDIGNYIYDSIAYISGDVIHNLSIVIGIGKLTKIYQGKKNTNNKYGILDFNELADCLESYYFNPEIVRYSRKCLTVKSIETFIASKYPELLDKFYNMILLKASETFTKWLKQLNTGVDNLQIILVIDKNKSENMIIQL